MTHHTRIAIPGVLKHVAAIPVLLHLATTFAAAEDVSPPDAALAAVQGEWDGTLRYRDYSEPDQFVTLPTRLFVALGAPNELVLHFIYDDGPSKTVHSYDRMTIDAAAKTVTWSSHDDDEAPRVHTITADSVTEGTRVVVFERPDGDKRAQYKLALSPRTFLLLKGELSGDGGKLLRNYYAFRRPEPAAAANGATP